MLFDPISRHRLCLLAVSSCLYGRLCWWHCESVMFSKVELAKKAEFLDRTKVAREERATERQRELSAIKIQARLFPVLLRPGSDVKRYCLFVCLLAYLKNRMTKFYQIFCTCYPWLYLFPPVMTVCYILVVWMTSCFHIMEGVGQYQRWHVCTKRIYGMFHWVHQVAAPVGRQMTFFGRVLQVMAPGAKSAISDCICYGMELKYQVHLFGSHQWFFMPMAYVQETSTRSWYQNLVCVSCNLVPVFSGTRK